MVTFTNFTTATPGGLHALLYFGSVFYSNNDNTQLAVICLLRLLHLAYLALSNNENRIQDHKLLLSPSAHDHLNEHIHADKTSRVSNQRFEFVREDDWI